MSSDASQSRPLFVEKTELIKSTEKVSRVIDGDTFEIEGGIKIRLIGMDTPEMKNKNRTIDCYAIEAKKRLESLIADKEVVLAKDVSETDKYGRLLRYVYLEDQFVNNTMIKEGYARISTFPPDVKFKDQLLTSERQARETGAGLWSACK
jgi:micrococcal nuclease